ncbi:MAG: arylamine N-acetyltransferase [bacterium]
MNAARLDAYLARLGRPDVSIDAAGLARLQAAHLMAVPFHNLLLVANDGQPWELPALPAVIDAAIAGVGGNCDRTTPPFTALLQALGFDAHLAAATVRAPRDHFVCVVRVGAERFLCDVGNGHLYLRPWRSTVPDRPSRSGAGTSPSIPRRQRAPRSLVTCPTAR